MFVRWSDQLAIYEPHWAPRCCCPPRFMGKSILVVVVRMKGGKLHLDSVMCNASKQVAAHADPEER